MSVSISAVFVTQDRVVGTAEAAIKALYSGDFINNGTYPFEADSFVSVEKKYAVFIGEDLAMVCESLDQAESVVLKIEKAVSALDQIGINEPVSLLGLFEHREMFQEGGRSDESLVRRIEF